MKNFAYFPGCSLEKMASSYHKSALETTKAYDIELQELDDWNCCGATTYFHVDQLLAHTLVARNLALAEKEGLDLVAPCSACYKNAFFTNKVLKDDPDLAEHINFALEEDDLQFNGEIDVHHLIEIFANEVGPPGRTGRKSRILSFLRKSSLPWERNQPISQRGCAAVVDPSS